MRRLFGFLLVVLSIESIGESKGITEIFNSNCIYNNYERIDTVKIIKDIVIDTSKISFDQKCSEDYVFETGAYSFTQLGKYCYDGDIQSLVILINNGACINNCLADPTYVYDLIYTAFIFQKIDIIHLLLKNRIYRDIDYEYTDEFTTLLYLACKLNDHKDAIDIVKILISKGAQVNITGFLEGETINHPIIAAVDSDNVLLVKLLLDKGADIGVVDREGFTVVELVENYGSDQMKALFHNYIDN